MTECIGDISYLEATSYAPLSTTPPPIPAFSDVPSGCAPALSRARRLRLHCHPSVCNVQYRAHRRRRVLRPRPVPLHRPDHIVPNRRAVRHISLLKCDSSSTFRMKEVSQRPPINLQSLLLKDNRTLSFAFVTSVRPLNQLVRTAYQLLRMSLPQLAMPIDMAHVFPAH